MIAAGTVRDSRAEAAAAHRLKEENTLKKAGTLSGKIVVAVGSDAV